MVKKIPIIFVFLGVLAILLSLLVFVFTFIPVALVEINYAVNKPNQSVALKPIDEDFGIVIPKIGANAKVIANVDPYNSQEYQQALTKGVAHARGTVFPGQPGNIFIFSHSSVDFYQATRYNSIFYLLSKLEKEDEIYLFYQKEKFKYKVVDKKIVEPSEVKYLNTIDDKKTVTLMTCWPAGTTLRRLVVIGEVARVE